MHNIQSTSDLGKRSQCHLCDWQCTLENSVLVLSKPITCSTWILTFPTFFEYSTSCRESCCLLLVKDGITSLPPRRVISLSMSKPRSAKIRSPGSMRFKNPQLTVMHLSVARPPQHLDRKDCSSWCYT